MKITTQLKQILNLVLKVGLGLFGLAAVCIGYIFRSIPTQSEAA